jgi:hypothetical protein
MASTAFPTAFPTASHLTDIFSGYSKYLEILVNQENFDPTPCEMTPLDLAISSLFEAPGELLTDLQKFRTNGKFDDFCAAIRAADSRSLVGFYHDLPAVSLSNLGMFFLLAYLLREKNIAEMTEADLQTLVDGFDETVEAAHSWLSALALIQIYYNVDGTPRWDGHHHAKYPELFNGM